MPHPTLSIYLLGPFYCEAAGKRLKPTLSRKTRAILGYLALADGAHSRQSLYTLFCQAADDPAGALRWHLSRIRRQLPADLLLVDQETVRYDAEAAWIDAHELRALNPTELSSAQLTRHLAHYRGDLLEGLHLTDAPEFETWLLAERTRYQQLYERHTLRLIESLEAERALETALDWAQRLAQHNPLLEVAHGHLMWLYAKLAQRDAALRQYQQLAALLERELAVTPMEEIEALHAQILAGEIDPAPLSQPQINLAATDASQRSDDFVGRDAELAQLRAAWASAQQTGTAVVLVAAEAGGGKSRLLQEFTQGLAEVRRLCGTCHEATRHTPYALWLTILEAQVQQLDLATLEGMAPFWLDVLGQLVPALAIARGVQPRRDDTLNEHHLFMAVAEFLLRVADGPLLIRLDDLQWADDASLRLLQFVQQRAPLFDRAAPTLLIGAYRSEEAADNPPLLTLLDDLRHAGALTLLELTPLTAEAVQTLLTTHTCASLQAHDPAALGATLLEATGGNPLYLTEVLHELCQGDAVPEGLPLPPSLNDLVGRRLRQLAPNERQVLEALAVLDVPTPSRLVQRIAGRSDDEVFAALDAGLRWRLLQADDQVTPTHFDFHHDLMSAAVRGQLNAIRAQRLHQRAAEALQADGASAAQLAYHWRGAGNTERELQFAAQAGIEAVEHLKAYRDGKAYLLRAAELMTDPAQRVEVLWWLGRAHFRLGEWDTADAAYQEMLTLAEGLNDLEWHGKALFSLGELTRNRAQYDPSQAYLEAAQRRFTEAGSLKWLMRTLGGLGSLARRRGAFDAALAYAQQQREVSEEIDDEEGIALAHAVLGGVYADVGRYDEALAELQHMLDYVRRVEDVARIAKVIGNMGMVYGRKGDLTQASQCFQTQLKNDHDLGDKAGVATALNNLCMALRLEGHYDRARDGTLYTLRQGLDMGNRYRVTNALGNLAHIYALQEEHLLAEATFQRALALAEQQDVLQSRIVFTYQVARHEQQRGNHARALTLGTEALALAREYDRHDVKGAATLLLHEVRVALGQETVAEAVAQMQADLQADDLSEIDAAGLHYTIWLLDSTQSAHQQAAIEAHERLLQRSPFAVYRKRLAELTGQPAAPLPPAEPLPAFVTDDLDDLPTMLAEVDRLLDA